MRARALIAVLAITATCIVAGSLINPAESQARDCARLSGALVAYGHSYLRSPQIGGASASYATLAANQLGVLPVIRAVDGGTTEDVARLVTTGPTRWVPGSANLVLIDSAINDINMGVPTAVWTDALRRTLSAFADAPVPRILLVRPLRVAAADHPGQNNEVIEAYAAQQRAVASEFSSVHIVDASSGWDPQKTLSKDGIHPNEEGELHLAKAVRRAAQRTFCST